MQRRAAAGKSRDREIETAPEEMHGARLSKKRRAEIREDLVRTQQDAPEAVCEIGIVGTVRLILVERNRVWDFVRHRIDTQIQPEFTQRHEHRRIEGCNRHGLERNRVGRAVAHTQPQKMVDEIELDLEIAPGEGDHGRVQSARSDMQRQMPGMVQPRPPLETDLTHDLRPQMQRVTAVPPRRIGQFRPQSFVLNHRHRLPFVAPPQSYVDQVRSDRHHTVDGNSTQFRSRLWGIVPEQSQECCARVIDVR